MADGSTTSTNFPSQQQGKPAIRLVDGKIGSKHGNIIHRTTSESLRLGGNEHLTGSAAALPPSPSSIINANSSQSSRNKSKNSSFQITSVTVGTRMSADNGDDSADDLDESHTDDNSRITDLENETPSFSEDTFSKEDVFFSSSGIGTAPVIPTSSQYGLAIVAPDPNGSGNQSISDVHHVSVTDAGINIVGGPNKHDVDLKDMHNRNERFKVVKIESTEPFKRGRWMCMDYLDHTTLQQSSPQTEGTKDGTADSGIVINENCEQDHSNEDSPNKTARTEINVHSMIAANLMAGQSAPGGGYPVSASTSPGQTLSHPLPSATETNEHITSHAQTMSHVSINENVPIMVAPAQSLPPQQLQQMLTHSVVSNDPNKPSPPAGPSDSHNVQMTPPIADVQATQSQHHNAMQGQSQPSQFYSTIDQLSHCQGQTLPAGSLQGVIHSGQPLVSQPQPLNVLPQSGQGINILQTVQDPMNQPKDPNLSNIESSQNASRTIFPQSNVNNVNNVTNVPQPSVVQQQPTQDTSSYQSVVQPASIPVSIAPQLQQTTQTPGVDAQHQQQPQIAPTVGQTFVQGVASQNFDASLSVVATPNNNLVNATSNHPVNNTVVANVQLNPDEVSSVQPSLAQATGPVHSVAASGGSAEMTNIQQQQQATDGSSSGGNDGTVSASIPAPTTSGTGTVPSSGDEPQSTEENESASGASAVAIDNKIEQAMDLVKSHLMFAVREEVEVLKEKIAELMDRINQLELENTILKANASQETLSQLLTIAPVKPQQNPNPPNGSMS